MHTIGLKALMEVLHCIIVNTNKPQQMWLNVCCYSIENIKKYWLILHSGHKFLSLQLGFIRNGQISKLESEIFLMMLILSRREWCFSRQGMLNNSNLGPPASTLFILLMQNIISLFLQSSPSHFISFICCIMITWLAVNYSEANMRMLFSSPSHEGGFAVLLFICAWPNITPFVFCLWRFLSAIFSCSEWHRSCGLMFSVMFSQINAARVMFPYENVLIQLKHILQSLWSCIEIWESVPQN